MKLLSRIVAVLVILVVVLFVVSLFLPSSYEVERTIVIDAPVEAIFDQVQDLEKRQAWSPWEQTDPEAEITIGPTAVGVGAFYTWDGEKVGKGKLTIAELEINRRLVTDLEFGDGGETARGEWRFEEQPAGVRATWKVAGELEGPVARYFGLLAGKYLGESFDQGLANLKRVAEAAPAPAPKPAAQPSDEAETVADEESIGA